MNLDLGSTIKRVVWDQPRTGWGRAAAIGYYSYLSFFLLTSLLVIVQPDSSSFDCYFPSSIDSSPDAESIKLLRMWLYRVAFTNYAGLGVLCWIVGPTIYANLTLFLCVGVGVIWNWVCYLSLTVDDTTVYECFEQSVYIMDPIFLSWSLFSLVCACLEVRAASSLDSDSTPLNPTTSESTSLMNLRRD